MYGETRPEKRAGAKHSRYLARVAGIVQDGTDPGLPDRRALMNMKLLLPAIVLLCAATSMAAEIYRHVDAQGRVTYTDQPAGNASPVVLESINTLPATAAPAARQDKSQGPAPFTGYESLTLAGVENNAVLRNPTAPVTVTARLQPRLQPGHTLLIHHNGQ